MTNNEFDIESLHKELLILLQEFDSYCRMHSIEYSLAYGSLLGATRHGGFIPWDDDIDIMLTRENYNKFQKCIVTAPFPQNYRIIQPLWLKKIIKDNDEKISLDLFVLDNVPNNKIMAVVKKYILLLIQGMIKPSLSKEGNKTEKALSVITYIIGRLFPFRLKNIAYEWVSCYSNRKKTREVAIYNGVYKYVKTKTDNSSLINGVEDVRFESIVAMQYINNKVFLETTYGDYMTPPPIAERIPSHIRIEDK